MVYILLGSDDFSKQEFVDELAARLGLPVERAAGSEVTIQRLTEASLFESAKIWLLSQALGPLEAAAHVDELAASANHIIFIEPKLDKRTLATQALLKDKRITVKEFAVPEGAVLVKWITGRVKERGGKIEAAAARALAERLAGEPTTNAFPARADAVSHNLWQAANEIDKLLEYSAGKPITTAAVEALVSPNQDIEVWKVINAIADKNLSGVLDYLQRFFAVADGSDEKAKVIQLNALLADQFRSIVMVQQFTAQRLPDSKILALTSWKQGRLFIVKKIAQRFKPELALDTLKKFEHLDFELKSSSTPPRVLLDLILSQALV